MNYVGGVTPKGTIFLRGFDKKGRLLNKRVWKDHIQTDTLFNVKKNRYAQILISDFNTNNQYMLLAPEKMNWLKKIIHKLSSNKQERVFAKNSKGELVEIFNPLNMNDLMKKGKTGQFTVGYNQGVTGFGNKETNEIFRKIKNDYLSRMFR